MSPSTVHSPQPTPRHLCFSFFSGVLSPSSPQLTFFESFMFANTILHCISLSSTYCIVHSIPHPLPGPLPIIFAFLIIYKHIFCFCLHPIPYTHALLHTINNIGLFCRCNQLIENRYWIIV